MADNGFHARPDAAPTRDEHPGRRHDDSEAVTPRALSDEPILQARPPEPQGEPPPPPERREPHDAVTAETDVAPAPASEARAAPQAVAEQPPALSTPLSPLPPRRLEQVVSDAATGQEATGEDHVVPHVEDEGKGGITAPPEHGPPRALQPSTPPLAAEPARRVSPSQPPPTAAEPRDDRARVQVEALATPAPSRPAEPARVLPRPELTPAAAPAPVAPGLEIGELIVEVVPPSPPPRSERTAAHATPAPRRPGRSAPRSQLRFGLGQI
jgi:hypothetical protein